MALEETNDRHLGYIVRVFKKIQENQKLEENYSSYKAKTEKHRSRSREIECVCVRVDEIEVERKI